MKNKIDESKRSLVASMLVGGSALTAAGLSSTMAFSEVDQGIKWDLVQDIVIAGYGAAGTAAAIEARKQGASVLVVERMEKGGGAIFRSGGIVYMGGGTPLQKSLGVEDSRDNMYKYMLAATGDGANAEMIGLYCDKSLELYQFLTENGVQFKESFIAGKHVVPETDDGLVYSGNEEQEPYRSISTPAARGHHALAKGFSGHAIIEPLQRSAEAMGIEVLSKTRVTKLILDIDGRVVGIKVTSNGSDLYIRAKKAVILTTGGFGANRDMIAQHCPSHLRCGVFIGTNGDDGSGIRMGQAVGADVRLMGEAIAYSPVYYPSENLVCGILVNDKGKRYVGEDQYGDWVGALTARFYPSSYVVIDKAIFDSLPDNAKSKLRIAAQEDSIGGLAKSVGIPVSLLENTISEYNNMCKKGVDEQFRKNKKFLKAIERAPFYALNYSADSTWFIPKGGIKINTKAQALDTEGNVIPGLFCAGTVCSQVIAQYYPGSGTLNGQALTFGRIAGQIASA